MEDRDCCIPDVGRRNLIKAAFGTATLLALPDIRLWGASLDGVQTRPDPATFQEGDFIWPKTPGKFVPYDSSPEQQYLDAKHDWEAGRDAFVRRAKTAGDSADKKAAESLEHMEFREFLALYEADEKPGVPGTYSSGSPLYVGHVGILSFDSNKPVVIEAVWGKVKQVRVIPYEDWLKERPDDHVWHGRLKQVARSDRAKIAKEALTHKGTKYDFWNFNLNDDRGFYCSKLVWLSVFRQLQLPVDNNKDPHRLFWFSPKQLLHSNNTEILFSPGNYTL
jgi:hypothetical protein